MTPAEMAQARINAIVEARVEKLLPMRVVDALLPIKAQLEEAEVALRAAKMERDYWREEFHKKVSVDHTAAWAARRHRENGRKKYSPCVDCGATCRGLRCSDCAVARRQ